MYISALPTGLWVEGKLAELSQNCIPFYYIQKGNHASGLVMLKLNGLEGACRLITQQRNFMTDQLEWVSVQSDESIDESAADAYIQRTIARDPDIWVIEIEDRAMNNPFEE